MQTVLVACTSAPSPEFIGRWQGDATTTGESTQLILEIEQQRAFITLPDISVGQASRRGFMRYRWTLFGPFLNAKIVPGGQPTKLSQTASGVHLTLAVTQKNYTRYDCLSASCKLFTAAATLIDIPT
jgi:hypothetical protein